MSWFIKSEQFTKETSKLSHKERQVFLEKHKIWVQKLNVSGKNVISGYLVNEKRFAGGGGLLILEADSYREAMTIVKDDPMITEGLVTWCLQEWIPVAGDLIS
tara:strand:- start:3220 stop:3528 length:309 start_codon:yes stop_codon:yes gene_type:complete